MYSVYTLIKNSMQDPIRIPRSCKILGHAPTANCCLPCLLLYCDGQKNMTHGSVSIFFKRLLKLCVKICILKQIIATILFMCIFSMKNKRSMLGFQSTTAPLTEGVLPVLLVRKHPSQYFHTFPLVPTAHVAVKCETRMCRTHRLSWKLVSKHGGSWRIWEDE